jgi:hypothetical protein
MTVGINFFILESETKFGKYARRYTQDTDLFSTKIPVHT